MKKYIHASQRGLFSMRESSIGFANSLFLQKAISGCVRSEKEINDILKKVTSSSIRSVANKFLTTKAMRVIVVGNIKHKKMIEERIRKIRI